MKMLVRAALALSALLARAPAIAADAVSGYPIVAPARAVPAQAMTFMDADGNAVAVSAAHPMPGGSRQEAFQLASANAPSTAATLFGGDYILAQTCSGYGALNLQVLGPDGTSWLTMVSKTASDAGGSGTGLAFGSFAQVRVTVTGTTACNATLSRVP